MSAVTGIVLQTSVGEDNELYQKIDEWLCARGYGGPAIHQQFFGSRHPQIEVRVIGLNFFQHLVDDFTRLIRTLDWAEPHQVALLITTEDEATTAVLLPTI